MRGFVRAFARSFVCGAAYLPCVTSVSLQNIYVTLMPHASASSEIDRRESIEISDDLANALGITAADLHGDNHPNPQIRLRIQSASPANKRISEKQRGLHRDDDPPG